MAARAVVWIITTSFVLGLLHWGREVLQPLALAGLLSLALWPMVRRLRQFGLNHAPAVLLSVALVGMVVAWVATLLTLQLANVAQELPRYSEAIQAKAEDVRNLVLRPFEKLGEELDKIEPRRPVPRLQEDVAAEPADDRPRAVGRGAEAADSSISHWFSALWGPLGQAFIVMVLLVFVLLEHESLRDRLVSLTGGAQVARTFQALADTGEGVARFFCAQFLVNAGFALVLGLTLWALGVPHAALWGALGGMLRLVPYVGILAAGGMVTAFAAAVDPGWSLALSVLIAFGMLELLAANVLEPQVYGHSTGLSPLAVIVSALFWSAVWGPVGLLMSTPLTVCMVVVGRHVRALAPLSVLLTESTGISRAQRLYQRALAGETDEILRDARRELRREGLVTFFDNSLLPAVALAAEDSRHGHLGPYQREHLRDTLIALTEALSGMVPTRGLRRRPLPALAHATVGAYLRQARLSRQGRWQGGLDVPESSVVVCVGLLRERDALLTELLVRALSHAGLDARSICTDDPLDKLEPEASRLVSSIFIAAPLPEDLEPWIALCQAVRGRAPQAMLVAVRPPLEPDPLDDGLIQPHVDLLVRSYSEAAAFALQASRGQAQRLPA